MNWREGCFYASAVVCSGGLVLSSFAADLVTLSGRHYKNYEVRNVTDRSVDISHDTGAASVPFAELPEPFIRGNPEVAEKIKQLREQKLAKEKAEKERQDRERKRHLREVEKNAYEKARQEQFLKALFLPPPPETAGKKRSRADILPNILFIEGDNGAGTGFKVKFGRENVIISNAHVYLALANPRIRDSYGNEYKVEQMISSRERDLVILKYRPFPGEAPLLNVTPAVTSLRVDSMVVAYGNSQGEKVNTTLPGRLLGIGYDVIEIDCGIVPGNSGGPVLLQSSGDVIGVSTYGKTRVTTAQTAGTRFGSRSLSNPYVVRRFATRIDNLKMEDLEMLSQSDLNRDRQYFAQINDVLTRVGEILESKSSNSSIDRAMRKLQTYLQEVGPSILAADDYQWASSYLRREYKERRDYLQRCFKVLDIGDLVLASRLNDIWKHADVKVRDVSVPARKQECPKCQGAGQIRASPFGLSIRKGDSFKRSYESCSHCNGTGSITTEEGSLRREYSISSSAFQEFNQCIRKSSRSFNGFTIGGFASEELRRFSYYDQSKLLEKDVYQLAESYTYQGNHRINEALRTRFIFIFGRLLKVVVVLRYTPHSQQFFEKYVKDNFSNPDEVYDVNCSVAGRYLLLYCEHDALEPLIQLTAATSKDGKDLL